MTLNITHRPLKRHMLAISSSFKLKRDLSWPKSPTKARAEPEWPRLLKEDPVRYMALYKADYIYTMKRTNLKWDKALVAPPSQEVGIYPNVSAKHVK